MNIAIKADGSTTIGMGHVMRTLVLANALSEKNNVFYICKSENEFNLGRQKIKSSDYDIYSNLDIDGDILITDSYDVSSEYFENARKHFKYLVYIDDLNLFYHPVDLVINQNINAEELNYKESNLLLGPKYALLRKEFQKCQSKEIKELITDILITMGGTDPYNLTMQLIKELNQFNYHFHVVVGSAFKSKESIYKQKYNNVILYENANMKSLMEHCDISVSACGSTLYELCACGTPALGIVVAENQKGSAKKFHELGLIKTIDDYDKIDWNIIKNEINSLSNDYNRRKKISKAMQQLVDGKGAERIADYINTNFK